MPIGSGTSGVGRENARTCGEILTELLLRLGLKTSDGDNRSAARSALNQEVNKFNLHKSWLDRLLTVVITLTETAGAGDRLYALPARFRKVIGRMWLQDTSGDRTIEVEYKPYSKFLRDIRDEGTSDALPRVATISNRVDTGQLEIWPAMSSTNLTIYPTIELVYFAEIPTCNDDNDNLAVSGGLEQAIFDGALVTLSDMRGDADKTGRFFAASRDSLRAAVSYDAQMRLDVGGRLRGSI